MAIPDFTADGVLPVGVHDAAPDDVRAHLVDPFEGSTTRAAIYQRWLWHREALQYVCPIEEQWLNGSFVTAKVDPQDVDLVTVIDAAKFEALPPALRLLTSSLLNGQYTRALWHCDSYVITWFESPDPRRSATEERVAYWSKWFGHTRDGVPKGFVRIR